MILKQSLLVLLATYCCFVNQVNGQGPECVSSVINLLLASNATLFWETDPGPCEVTSFQVYITDNIEAEYRFTVTDSYIDLSFLQICERWLFMITPISYNVTGYPHIMSSYIPLPPDHDLTLSYFSFNVSGSSVLLEWDLLNSTYGDCTLEYRLTLEDLDRGTMEDVYVHGKSALINNASPCISYQVNLRAINQAHPTIEGPLKMLYLLLNPRVQVAPTLKSVDIEPTSINMTWNLEGNTNRCPLRSFHIDGGVHFYSTVSLQGLLDPTTVSVQIYPLLPNSMYFMTASVENSAGRSPGAPIAVQTLELSPS